ncbi:MAG TPA: phosphatase PAP2 family protein [Sulfuricurvum sp.]|nr:phosphatase PAP2 family protein [Sulfuricurvum sp.]
MINICGNHDYVTDDASFVKNLLQRLWAYWCLKALGTMGFIALFFTLYFYLLTHHYFSVTSVPLTGIDKLIPFNPMYLYFYLSLWVYVSLPPALMKSKKELFYYGGYVGVLSLIGILFYVLFPTVIPQDIHDWENSPDINWLKSVDMGGNAFPSMHVASAFFSFFWLNTHLMSMNASMNIRIINFFWCMGIIYSTMAIKQHVFLDVLGGLILGAVISFYTLQHHKKAF